MALEKELRFVLTTCDARSRVMNFLRRMRTTGVSPNPDSKTLFSTHFLLHGDRNANEAWIRSLCDVAYLGNNTALCRSLGRYKMLVDTNDHGLAPHIMLDGYWEMWVTEIIASQIRAGMVVADIGANVGYYTMLMAELVGPRGRVHAFEPNPAISRLLRRSLDINGFLGWTELHETALGDTNGATLAFVIPDNEPKNGHLQPHTDPTTAGCTAVQTLRLDSKPDWRQIQFAKIDVEGAEEMIWTGASGLIESGSLRSVVLEFTPARYTNAVHFLEQIQAGGFAINLIDPWRGLVESNIDGVIGGDPREDRMLLLTR